MATAQQDPMADVERRRVQLEENVSKLRDALKHWRTWEFEYEMLKEEIQAVDNPSPDEMVEIGCGLDTSLLDEKEIIQLVGNEQTKRTANQVIDMISRRVDYVQQNITTAAKQLDAAEKRLAGTSVLLEPDLENEEGLPLMDIQEELDEEGNIISSSVLQPGKSAPEIVEALRKAAIQKLEKKGPNESEEKKEGPSSISNNDDLSKQEGKKPLQTTGNGTLKSEPVPPPPAPTKKSVSFSEDTKEEAVPEGRSALERSGYNEELADYNFTKGTRVIEVDEDDNEIASYPIIPQGESPEDAELRRQMLQYGLSEVGRVVAEIDLDGRDEDYSDEELDDDYSEEDESELEDEYGRSLKREITDEYRAKMLELEKKLNARMLQNVGPRPDVHPLAEYSDDIRTLKIKKDAEFDESIPKEKTPDAASQKKGVRFADTLDIAPASPPVKDQIEASEPSRPLAPTISDTIVERTGPAADQPTPEPPKPAKVSRFKNSRAGATQPSFKVLPNPSVPEPLPVPQGPKGQTLASTIVEHEQTSEPHVPDEFDPVVVNREIQVQYHKMRNRMIQQQGGFTPTQEEEDYPLVEEQDGKTKKVSRFRAARLKADGL